jgi:hypothetical protein
MSMKRAKGRHKEGRGALRAEKKEHRKRGHAVLKV